MNPTVTVCLPTLKRPELLALTLERLSLNPEVEQLDIRIFLDTCSDERADEVEFVRDTYLPIAEIFRAGEHVKALSGTWNILNSLKQGWETGSDFVVLLEEDVLVKPTFVEWHLDTQTSDDYFVTCGRRHGHMPDTFYSNPGTCYRRDMLAHVIPHICDEYFQDNEGYLEKHFPGTRGLDGLLDDGLIRKVCRSLNGKVKCADPPVCAHVGFRYYQKFGVYANEGTIQQRIAWIRWFLSDIPKRKEDDPRYIQDLECI